MNEKIAAFLAHDAFAVVGASDNRSKYGNKVLRAYQQRGHRAFPVNPNQAEVEGLPCYADLASLPEPGRAVSIVTPPQVTERIVAQAAEAGVEYVWMQPGAESAAAVRRTEELGLTVIAGGPCVLVACGITRNEPRPRVPGDVGLVEAMRKHLEAFAHLEQWGCTNRRQQGKRE